MQSSLLLLVLTCCWSVDSVPVIGWDSSTSNSTWSFSSLGLGRRSHRHKGHSSCNEPDDLSKQFMQWFRESHSDPSILTYLAELAEDEIELDALKMKEPAICNSLDATDDKSIMARSLCPWEWRINRDEHREPKLISEAHCLCHKSRGSIAAQCVPILREFPVLKRIFCDHRRGSYRYMRTYETVTVGCHSVIPRTHLAEPLESYLDKHHPVVKIHSP